MDTIGRYLPLRDHSAGVRRKLTATALRIFAGWGYQEVEVPLIDYFDALKKGLSSKQADASLRFLDRSGNVMMLRVDTTPAIAKMLAHRLQKTTAPQRLCYANKVVRIAERTQDMRLEGYQIGVELVGVAGLGAEVELICICMEVLNRLDIKSTQINVTDHALVHRLLELTGAPGRIREEVRRAIMARDPSQACSILSMLGVREKYIQVIEAVAAIQGGKEQLGHVERLVGGDPVIRTRLERIKRLLKTLNELGYGDVIRIDFAELRTAHYYDGIAFNVVSEGVGQSIGSGGRYDGLYGVYGKSAPAVGFVLFADLLSELIYPTVSMGSPHVGIGDSMLVEDSALAEGFKAILERRREGVTTRVVNR